MIRVFLLLTAICTVTFYESTARAAAEIAIGLTAETIEVDADFSGARLVLYGAVSGVQDAADAGDIVAIIRGPALSFRLRPIVKKGLVWVPGESIDINDAPGLYITSSTRPLDDFSSKALQQQLKLGSATINVTKTLLTEQDSGPMADAYSNFVTSETKRGRYQDHFDAFTFKKDALFSFEIDLPPTTPVGDYAVEVFLIDQGGVVAADTAALSVRKVGLERQIYDLAHDRPLGYGIMCVALSLLAGWLAALAFRK